MRENLTYLFLSARLTTLAKMLFKISQLCCVLLTELYKMVTGKHIPKTLKTVVDELIFITQID